MKNILYGLIVGTSLLLAIPAVAGAPEPEYYSGDCAWKSTFSTWESYQTMSRLQRHAMHDGYDFSCDEYFMQLKNAR